MNELLLEREAGEELATDARRERADPPQTGVAIAEVWFVIGRLDGSEYGWRASIGWLRPSAPIIAPGGCTRPRPSTARRPRRWRCVISSTRGLAAEAGQGGDPGRGNRRAAARTVAA